MNDPAQSTFVPDPIAAASATCIVHGVITSIEGDRADLLVDDVERGASQMKSTTLSVRCGAWAAEEGGSGWFFLDSKWDHAVLLRVRTRREMERVVAGLPRSDARLLPDDLRRLFDSADAVVIGNAVPTSSSEAVIDVIDSRKGELSGEISVARGFESDEPGGPWEFDTTLTGDSPGPNGLYFLTSAAGPWLVMNPSDPRVLSPLDLDEALSAD